MSKKRAIINGAGPAGLTTAYELLQRTDGDVNGCGHRHCCQKSHESILIAQNASGWPHLIQFNNIKSLNEGDIN